MRDFGKRFLSIIATLALGAGLVTVGSTAATAAPIAGIVGSILKGGQPLAEGAIVDEGTELTLRVQYAGNASPSLAGQSVPFELGSAVTVTEIPAGNVAIESITRDGNSVVVNFKDPWPAGVDQGFFDLKFTVNNVDDSRDTSLTWEIGDESYTLGIVVKNAGDSFENVQDGVSKTNNNGAPFNSYVKVADDAAGITQFVGLDAGIIGKPITYTLTVNTPKGVDRTGFSIADVLPAGLRYVAGSFSQELTTWDANGYNRTTATSAFTPTISGSTIQSFVSNFDLPSPSELKITYKAEVPHETARALLEGELRTAFGALGGKPGSFNHALTNTATFGSGDTAQSKTSKVTLTGTVAGPGVGNALSKTVNWTNKNLITDETGLIVDEAGAPAPVSTLYSIGADLSPWDGRNSNFTLTQDVIVTDTLPTQARWQTEISDFLTIASGSINGVSTLTKVDTCTDNASVSNPGEYCVNGQTLRINVGQHKSTNPVFAVKAQLTTLEGLSESGTSTVKDAKRFLLRNTAVLNYATGGTTTKNADSYPVRLPSDRTDGLNDTSAFLKAGPDKTMVVSPGATLPVPYQFTVNTAETGVSVSDSRIVDYVDASVFDVSDLAATPVEGSYGGQALSAQDYALSVDGDGNLVIQLSDAGKALVAPLAEGQTWIVTIRLTTRPLAGSDGKETIDVKNRATLFGQSNDPLYWSESSSRGTSFGDEAEVRKHVYDRTDDEWANGLRVATDADGNLVEDTYVYRVQFLGHGSFGGVSILDVVDALPVGAEFLGFVTEADAATAANPTAGPVDVGANLEATFDAALGDAGTVTISQKSGTFPIGGEAAAYFAVKIANAQEPVVNKIGDITVAIVPVGPPSIDIEKWSDEGEAPEYDEETGALLEDNYAGDFDYDGVFDAAQSKSLTAGVPQLVHFTISNDGPDALRDVTVTDERMEGSVGDITDLTCVFPDDTEGTTWEGPFEPATQFECEGTLPGLTPGAFHANTAKVTGIGIVTGTEVNDEDTWNAHVKSFAVGDYVWIDSNRDGVQDENEAPLEGVTVELLDDEGEVIGTTTTDDRGRYFFDNLPAGTYQVQFTLTEEQGKRYRYTSYLSGEDAAVDSNSEVDPDNRLIGVSARFDLDESNSALTADENYEFFDIEATEGIDPTWDAGVTEILYAIGDYVWIDEDRDGVQDKNEKPLAGVKVELLDEDGEVVGTTTTDAKGRYIFDSLFAGTYQVRFTLTPEQAKWYQFTKTGSGDAANDSDAHGKTGSHIGTSKLFELGPENTALTHEYDREFWASEGIDPTWDAGVVVRPEHLAATGSAPQVMISLLGTGGFMLLLGGALLMLRRRMQDA